MWPIKMKKKNCDLRESQSLNVFEIALFEINLLEGPLKSLYWIDNFQISGIRFKFGNP